MPGEKPVLSVRNVAKTFDLRDRAVLEDVSLDVSRGETVAISGPSGCGKTTLLSIIAGLTPPDRGEIAYRFPGREPVQRLTSDLRRRYLGIVFQSIHLISTLTVVENVELPLFGIVSDRHEREQRARAALEKLGLGSVADRRPQDISGGEQQRAAVARAFVNRPSLILADEPTGSLDRISSDIVVAALVEMAAETDGALILVTHDPEVSRYAQRQLDLIDGRFREVRSNPEPTMAAS